ncbi:MAG: hypothetical protein H8E40_03530 [Chloroflexi bacterium]|nr:hypothetical protein [Chloroflexota bacterium]
MGLQLLWYDDDLSSPEYQGDLTPYIEDLGFTTKLHGGFDFLIAGLNRPLVPAWRWLQEHYHHRLILLDRMHQTHFEGRVEDVRMTDKGVEIVVAGYWASCFDQVYNRANAGLEDISVLIKAALTDSCPAISSDQSNIADNTMEVPQYLDDDRYPGDLITGWCEQSDSEGDATYFFAVWENRIPHYSKIQASEADWVVHRSALAPQGLRLQASAANIYTRVKTKYSNIVNTTSAELETAWASDYTGPLGSAIRDHVLSLSGSTSTAAQKARDAFLAAHVNLKYNLAITVEKKMTDAQGALWPNWYVRAGDVIDILDLIPHELLFDLSESGLDRIYIKATHWRNGSLEIVPDMEPEMAALVLANVGS